MAPFSAISTFFVCFLYVLCGSIKLIELRPLKCRGFLSLPAGQNGLEKRAPAAYLGRKKLEIIDGDELSDNEVILCDVVPIPLLDPRGESLVAVAVKASQKGNTRQQQLGIGMGSGLVNRDKGLYDNLPYSWLRGRNAKLELYNSLNDRLGPAFVGELASSPHLSFLKVAGDLLRAEVTGLLIEVRDELSSETVALGAAMVFAKRESNNNSSNNNKWKVSQYNTILPQASSTDDDIAEEEACLVNIHLDELVGISLAANLPIFMPQQLFESTAIDARLLKTTDGDDENKVSPSVMSVYGPVFRNAPKKEAWKEQGLQVKQQRELEVLNALPAWEIYNPQKFLKMSSVEKRAVLRASGVTSLPRPRQGVSALDRALLDLMDEAVRGEVLRFMSLDNHNDNNGSGNNLAAMAKVAASPRQQLLMQIGIALEEGDTERAEALREKFALMTVRRADPTQKEGSYDKFLDQDEWYLEQRRRAMAPKNKT